MDTGYKYYPGDRGANVNGIKGFDFKVYLTKTDVSGVTTNLQEYRVLRNSDEIIFNLQLAGYNVVLAHPERYLYYGLQDYERLTNKGVLLQLNLLSITGYYSLEVKKQAEKLINADLVSFVGTDCHNMRHIENLKFCLIPFFSFAIVFSGTTTKPIVVSVTVFRVRIPTLYNKAGNYAMKRCTVKVSIPSQNFETFYMFWSYIRKKL